MTTTRTEVAGLTRTTEIEISGPYDLREVALMGFGHRDERSFDGVMRLAFCVDGTYEDQVGVELTGSGHGQRVMLIDRLVKNGGSGGDREV